MSCCQPPDSRTYLRRLLARRDDIAIYPADALDRDEPPEDVYLYRPSEILVPNQTEQIRLFEEVATSIGLRYTRTGCEPHASIKEDQPDAAARPAKVLDRGPVDWPAAPAARFYIQSRSELETVLRRLERASGNRLRVSPNHIVSGCPFWDGSPYGDPSLPPEGTVPTLPLGGNQAAGVVVAVVDSGVPEDYDLNPILSTLESLPIDLEPWLYSSPTPVLTHPQGHGSFVAGMVFQAASEATVCSYMALDTDGVNDEWYLGYQVWLALNNPLTPSVINLSLGARTRADASLMGLGDLAVRAREPSGPIVVAAAGNWGSDRPYYPAADDWTISVGAVQTIGDPPVPVPAVFSDYGCWVDVCAVGVDVVSAFEAKPYRPLSDPTTIIDFKGVAQWNGTSFSTPHVSGEVAKILALQPSLDRGAVIAELGALGGQYVVPGLGWWVP